eukprot:GHVS01090498.1.p1 GENE.GHVS01090498.1~~GHVS01090498.1.p1  ORF type:complete len:435 (-),score=98.66 GHVS01090498.1:146-1450(-)
MTNALPPALPPSLPPSPARPPSAPSPYPAVPPADVCSSHRPDSISPPAPRLCSRVQASVVAAADHSSPDNSPSRVSSPGGGGATVGWKQKGLERVFPNEEDRELFLNASYPKLLVCGRSRSGKSSVCKVVFGKMSPHQTLCLPPTVSPEIHLISTNQLTKFCLVDVPGNFLLMDTQCDEVLFSSCTTLLFILDAQNELSMVEELAYARQLLKRALTINRELFIELFIHKMDGDFFAVESVRSECQRDLHERLLHQLQEAGISASVVFYSTSIYDNTVFEACSRVVQRLIPHAVDLEHLLDQLVANSRLDKAFLIDVASKTFVATDTSPFDPFNYELCTDMIDVVIEMSCMYARNNGGKDGEDVGGEEKVADDGSSGLMCLIQLNSGHVLYLREINRYVMLTCVTREENFERQYLVDYNIAVLKEGVLQLINSNR